jgi:hypothetical protein
MKRLIADNCKNAEVIFPYIGGEEVNTSPTHAHHRYVINFGERSEEECRREWPEIMRIVESKVKPERIDKPGSYSRQWWLYGRRSQAGSIAIAKHEKVLMHSFTSKYLQFAFVKSGYVYAGPHIVFALSGWRHFGLLQSRLHEVHVEHVSSTMGDGLRYAPSDAFETFPLPSSFLNENRISSPIAGGQFNLESVGKQYYEYRAELMVSNNEGLTSTYNRFHDPSETSSDLLELRRLHSEMDQAVLAAYGWSDVPTTFGFGLDYLDTEDDAQLPDGLQERIDSGELFFWDANDALDFQGQLQAYGAITGRRKLPWRYRWPDAVRDDVLARLLALNAERYAEEVALGLHSKAEKAAAKASKAGGTAGARRRGRPPKAVQAGETEPMQDEQIRLGL